MASKHTVATLSDGNVVRRLRDDYWTGYINDDGTIEDGGEWIRGGRISASDDDGYWTPESLLAVVCDLANPDYPVDDDSPAHDRWGRLCDVLDEMQRDAAITPDSGNDED